MGKKAALALARSASRAALAAARATTAGSLAEPVAQDALNKTIAVVRYLETMPDSSSSEGGHDRPKVKKVKKVSSSSKDGHFLRPEVETKARPKVKANPEVEAKARPKVKRGAVSGE